MTEETNKKQCRDTVGVTLPLITWFGEHDPLQRSWRTWLPLWRTWRTWSPHHTLKNLENMTAPWKLWNIDTLASLPCQTTKVRLPCGTSHNKGSGKDDVEETYRHLISGLFAQLNVQSCPPFSAAVAPPKTQKFATDVIIAWETISSNVGKRKPEDTTAKYFVFKLQERCCCFLGRARL